jgi:protein TonB
MFISSNLVAKIAKKLNIYLIYRKKHYLCIGFIHKQMEVKKSREADLEQKRTQSFLLGMIVVLASLFVLLEWNSGGNGWSLFDDDESLEAEVELAPLKRDKDEVPMMMPQEQKVEKQESQQLHLVDNDVELPPEPILQEETAEEEPTLKAEEEKPQVVDMYDEPIDFRVVEDLPQFPGGAAEFMKWLTKNLKYPPSAQQRRIKGKVVAQFIVNKDGTLSDLQVIQPLEPACDQEVLRVLKTMPQWKAGMMNAKPCRTMVCIPIVFNL